MEQFTLAIKFTAKTENHEQFKLALVNLFETVRQEPHFVEATIHQNIQKKEEFLVYEIWNDNIEHFMNVTLKKPYAVEWDRVLIEMEVLREPSVYSAFKKFGK